jgi:hypothetical protein
MFLQSILHPTAVAAAPVVAATPTPAAAAAPPAGVAASAAAAEQAAVPVAPQPVEDASFAARLFGKVGMSQNRFLANQQVLGQVTAVLGARLTQSFSNAMRILKGEPEPHAGVTG